MIGLFLELCLTGKIRGRFFPTYRFQRVCHFSHFINLHVSVRIHFSVQSIWCTTLHIHHFRASAQAIQIVNILSPQNGTAVRKRLSGIQQHHHRVPKHPG